MSYLDDEDDMSEYRYESLEEVESLEEDEAVTRNNYRVLMYRKVDVEALEKSIIKEILLLPETEKKLLALSPGFFSKAVLFFPELFEDTELKKKRGKKTNNYFLEDVGKFLWLKWHKSQDYKDRNDFLTYCYPLIDGVIFKYQRHKHGLPYSELFQGAIIKIIQALDKFDPMRVVGYTEDKRPIYARVYTYFTMILNFGITTITMSYGAEKLTNVSYENLSKVFGNAPELSTDAGLIFQEFLLVLDSICLDDSLPPETLIVLQTLNNLLKDRVNVHKLVNNLVYTLKNECGVKIKDVTDALDYLKEAFGPLVIFSESTKMQAIDIFNKDN